MVATSPVTARSERILIVDDEVKILKLLSRSFVRDGYDVTVTTDPRHALRMLRDERFDLLLLDNRMPGLTGLELLKHSHGKSPGPEVVMMTAYATVPEAVEAMKLGAIDYVQKPFDFGIMKQVVARALGRRRAAAPVAPSEEPVTATRARHGIVGRSPALDAVWRRIEAVAETRSTVLITGETGTGKELVARAIHRLSPRRARPLVRVNCAAIPDGLLESEMFGHVRGAFTGATQSRPGKFSVADGGTLFLDEVSALSLPLQRKLLRVLQEMEFEPLGSDRTQTVDVRILAATNRDLASLAEKGEVLADLYYRLNVIPIRVPPLRERREDVPLLAESFLALYGRKLGKSLEGFEPSALSRLRAHSWPGNVRELENAIERAVALTRGPRILAEDLLELEPLEKVAGLSEGLDLRGNLSRVTRATILRSLEAVGGRKKDAAALLGISQRALSYYLRKYGI